MTNAMCLDPRIPNWAALGDVLAGLFADPRVSC
jgi:hypothetical protein